MTPIAVINDVGNKVISVFDEELKNKVIGIHPMENSATVFISFEDLIKSIKDYQNRIIICKIK